MAQKDSRRQEIENAAATLARLLIGEFWERMTNPVMASSPQLFIPERSPGKLLTGAEVMAELHISRSTLKRRVDSGELPRVKDRGKAARYRQEDVDRLKE